MPGFAVMLPLKPGGDFAPVDGCFFFGLYNLVAHLICRFGFDHVFGIDGFDDEIRQVTVHLSIVVRIFDIKDFSGAVVVDFEPFLHGRRAFQNFRQFLFGIGIEFLFGKQAFIETGKDQIADFFLIADKGADIYRLLSFRCADFVRGGSDRGACRQI